MNKEILQGNWKMLKGKAKETWGRLTDDELDQIEGRWERLVGKLQQRYGYTRQEAEDAVDDFMGEFDDEEIQAS